MIDNYLQELFRPDTGGGMFSGGGDDSARLMDILKGTGMGGGGPTSSPYPMPTMAPDAGGSMDMSARSVNPLMPPGGDIPLPRPRRPEAPPGQGQGGGAPPPTLPDNLMAMLRGPGGVQVPEGMPQQQQSGPLGLNMKRLQASLAGGFAGGNPDFKGGAFMKGAGGSMTGGLKSDKEDQDQATAKAAAGFKNNLATQDMARKNKQTDALAALYGARTESTIKGKTSTAWNKPPNERWKDAQKLIIDKQKQLYGGINPLLPKATIDQMKADADKDMVNFKNQTYQQYGFSPDGQDVAPKNGARAGGPVPSSSRVIGDKEAEDAGLYEKSDMSGAGTDLDPHVLGGSTEDEMRQQFNTIKPGAFFINPADDRIMVKRAVPLPQPRPNIAG